MTIQFPSLETSDPRLLPDSYKSTNSDQSFEEKLKSEQARLALLFSPFNQLTDLINQFTPALSGGLESSIYQTIPDSTPAPESNSASVNYQETKSSFSSQAAARGITLFESANNSQFSRELLGKLLIQNNLLVPNIEAQPWLYQASLSAQFQPKLDLQSLIDQIIKQVELVKAQNKTQLTFGWQADELGYLLVTLVAQFGLISINLQGSPETKKLLEAQKSELEQALKQANIPLGMLTVEEVNQHA